jgi:hypothetical protein
MPSTLRLDLPFRFQRALQPDGLRVMQTCSAALTDALNDARRAGCNPETDPAVLLLGRHLGRVAAGECPERGHPEDDDLRNACEQRIAELQSVPILVPLIQRGLGCDPDLIRVYKSAAREALRYLAHTLCLDPANYNIQLDRHFTADNPAISLFADRFCVTIDPCRINPGREIGWVRTNGRDGPWAGRQLRGPIDLISNVTRFAATVRRDCHLHQPA